MDAAHSRFAGLDVDDESVVAAVRCVSAPAREEVRSFRTTTAGLRELSRWLEHLDITYVVVESSGEGLSQVCQAIEAPSRCLVLRPPARGS